MVDVRTELVNHPPKARLGESHGGLAHTYLVDIGHAREGRPDAGVGELGVPQPLLQLRVPNVTRARGSGPVIALVNPGVASSALGTRGRRGLGSGVTTPKRRPRGRRAGAE